tara:strand:- start:1912 stop:2628 length:717 start_codon:yes stop_codon:yes gene_type:complete
VRGVYLVPLAFFGFLAFGMPVGFAIGIAGMVGILDMGPRFMTMAPDRLLAGLDLFPFLAMPSLILAGEIMNRSGITQRLARGAGGPDARGDGAFQYGRLGDVRGHQRLGHRRRGGVRRHAVPAMQKAGYSRPCACAVTAAGSIIGPTIPPSTLAIVYGSIMGVSIAGLFAAGILPWLLMDINATLIILAPVLAPLTVKIGMDPVHAGIMIFLALDISPMTPPVGACLFALVIPRLLGL